MIKMVNTKIAVPKHSPVKYPPNILQSSLGILGAADIPKMVKAVNPPVQAPKN